MSDVINLRSYIDSSLAKTLVLLDVQRDSVADDATSSDVSAAIGNCRSVLRHARGCGLQVAFTRWLGRGAFFGDDTTFAGWLDGFEPTRQDRIFDRGQPSCYSNPLFEEVIGQGGGQFILAGITGETACLATAVDAFHRGHKMIFLADASACQRLGEFNPSDVHRVVTKVIGQFGEVMTTSAWIAASSRRARG